MSEIQTNHRAKMLMVVFVLVTVICIVIWAAVFMFGAEEPKPEPPVTQPHVCEEVTPEAPAELPKTGVDL